MQRADCRQADGRVRTVQIGHGQAGGNFRFHFGIGFDSHPLPQKLYVAFVQILFNILRRTQPHRGVRAGQAKAGQSRLQDAPQMVVGSDFGEILDRRGTRVFHRDGIDQSKRCGIIRRGRLQQENHLIVVAEVQAVFEHGRQRGLHVGMPALRQLPDDGFLIGERSFAQLPERREKTRVARGLCIHGRNTSTGEQQQNDQPLHAGAECGHLHLKFCPEHALVALL